MVEERGRGDGRIPIISVEAENLAEATYKSILACYEKGARIETPKHHEGGTLGYDADITVRVTHPDTEPSIYAGGMIEDGRGVIQYILEVTHGIHNHWKKSPEHPERWGYTYNERFVDQLPFVFQRIKDDWNKKERITGRDYQFTIWRPGEDIVLEQEDPPCFQRGNLRFVQNEEDKVSDMLQVPISMGAYIDRSSSLHLYGFYFDRDNFGKQIERMVLTPYEKLSYSLDDFLMMTEEKDETSLKRIIAAQMDAEAKGHGLNVSEPLLKELGYDLNNYQYPKDWDSWPKEWDTTPDITKLARVP